MTDSQNPVPTANATGPDAQSEKAAATQNAPGEKDDDEYEVDELLDDDEDDDEDDDPEEEED